MQDERTIAVNVDDLRQLAFYAAQGILDESESPDVEIDDNGAKLADLLAMAFAHANLAADANGDDLPHDQADIVEALSGQLTARRLAA
ncbi:MAG: hypothetical protein JWO74_2281 [Solirubrobacterales bacterium]|nr:hypothetical protein [Solirubrobacterales bacterium]